MALTSDEILALMVSTLGQSVDNATGWKSTGPASGRNVLLTNERVITRALNDLDQKLVTVLSSVDGFSARFSEIVGDNYTTDQAAFEEIGSNLIVAVNLLKTQMETVLAGGPGHNFTEAEQAALDSGITMEILNQLIASSGQASTVITNAEVDEILGSAYNS